MMMSLARAVDRRDDRKAKSAQSEDQWVHEAPHFEMRPLARLLGLQINRFEIKAAAEDVLAPGQHHRTNPAVALLNLVEGQMQCADDGDVD